MKFKLLVLGIFIFATTVAFSIVIHTYVLRSRAAGASMPIRVTEKTGSISGTKDVIVTFTNGEKISSFTLVFKTTGSVKVQDSKEPLVLGSTSGTTAGFFTPLFPKTIEKISYGIQRSDADLPSGISVPVTLRCEGTGTGTFTIAAVDSQIAGIGKEFTLDAIEEGSYTCASGGAAPTSVPPSGIRAHFAPASAQLSVGQQITTNFVIDGFTTDQKVSGFNVKMKVDAGVDILGFSGTNSAPTAAPTIVAPTTAGPTASVPSSPGGTGPAPTAGSSATPFAPVGVDAPGCTSAHSWDSAARILRLTQLCTGPDLLSTVSVPVVVKGLSNATGTISILEQEVSGPQAPTGYTVGKETFSFQVGQGGGGGTGGPGGNVQIKLKLRLQGIQAKPKQTSGLQFKIGVVSSTQTTPVTQNASFTPEDSGLYSGTVGLNVTPGTGFCILVKGPQQLQKKICEQNPSELAPGSYKGEKGAIALVAGENSFDFSRIYMMSCDLPVQDGICNSQDLVKIRANLGNSSTQANTITDLNQDTTTNGTDWALALSSLSVKLDD